MEAIILAGGFGTRLREVVHDVPKPMAPIGKSRIPFLEYLLDHLHNNDVNRVVISTGYKAEYIHDYFGGSFKGMEIVYSREDKPLMTGGAVKKALGLCYENDIFIVNGDTYFPIDLRKLLEYHKIYDADFSIAIKKLYDFDRYGTICFSDDMRIVSFSEKQYQEFGWINGGVYCAKTCIFESFLKEVFSLEKDFLAKMLLTKKIMAVKFDDYFLDIGIPEDYFQAQERLGHGSP